MRADHQHLFERREFKFLVPEEKAWQIRHAAQSVCHLDPFAGPDGTYTIRSLYFDTREHALYWANEHEQPERFKARIRCYPHDGHVGSHAWLEIKHKKLNTDIKSRVAVPTDRWVDILRSPTGLQLVDWPAEQKPLAEKFVRMVQRYHLEPFMLVEYDRMAYISDIDDYARLTLDRHIRCQIQERYDLCTNERSWRFVNHQEHTLRVESLCLIECKFGAFFPRWMMDLVQHFDMMRDGFSKYCSSVENQLLLPSKRISTW